MGEQWAFPPVNEGRDVVITMMIWNQTAKYFSPQLIFQRLDGLGWTLWEQLRVLKGAVCRVPSSDEVRKNSDSEMIQER